MRKYYESHVDFTEIATVSNDEISKDNAIERLTEAGAINAKGKPDVSHLSTFSASISAPFFTKLEKRLSRRRGGIAEAYETLKQMQDGKEFTAMYLYIVIMYGFLEWRVQGILAQLPAVPDALKAFMGEFMSDFEEYMSEMAARQEETQPVESSTDDSE